MSAQQRRWFPVALLVGVTGTLGCDDDSSVLQQNPAAGVDEDLELMFGAPGDPTTCEAAASERSYQGCDFWPTVTFNAVWDIFDFAVVVANVGAEPATISIAAPGIEYSTTVQPLSVEKIALPWVPTLKGSESDECGMPTAPDASVLVKGGAYHLTSTRPVTVYQFNALEYRGAGGFNGKSWDACPGHSVCEGNDGPIGCYSFSNDASILLPATALTGSYRVAAIDDAGGAAFLAITGTQDGTTVQVQLAPGASIHSGGPVTASGGIVNISLDAGDVAQLASDGSSDLGGSLVGADKPVQAIVGASCATIAPDDATCDHLEESLLPAETLGRRYLVSAPTGPLGQPSPYGIRIFGNVDGTTLSYPSATPPGAPATIDAGEVADLGIVNGDFEIVGDHEIAVSTFLPSAIVSNPSDTFISHGDPAQSQAVAVEQYRTSYVFLAPDDYDVSFVDVIAPSGTPVTLDGDPLPGSASPLGNSGFEVKRVRLGAGDAGGHNISADEPIGVQVVGYGAYTSYQYPAGMHLTPIAPPPDIK